MFLYFSIVLGDTPISPPFVRGDGNDDGTVNIADPIYMLNYLFLMGPSLCLDAHDCNDDGSNNIADPIFCLSYLFIMGPQMPEPFPDCGSDPTLDDIECEAYSNCP